MIGHEAVGVTNPVVSFVDVLECVQKVLAVMVVLEDGFLFVAAWSHVIYRAGVLYTKRASHEATIAQKRGKCNEKDLTLKSWSILCGEGVPCSNHSIEKGKMQWERLDPKGFASSSAAYLNDRRGSSRQATSAHKRKTLYLCGLPRTTYSYAFPRFSILFSTIIGVVDSGSVANDYGNGSYYAVLKCAADHK